MDLSIIYIDILSSIGSNENKLAKKYLKIFHFIITLLIYIEENLDELEVKISYIEIANYEYIY